MTNHDAMWPGQIRRDGHGHLWACTDHPATSPRWTRVTGYASDRDSAQFRLSEDDDTAILWDIEDEPIRPPLPTKQVRIDSLGIVWQKRFDGTWANPLNPVVLDDVEVLNLQVLCTPGDGQ